MTWEEYSKIPFPDPSWLEDICQLDRESAEMALKAFDLCSVGHYAGCGSCPIARRFPQWHCSHTVQLAEDRLLIDTQTIGTGIVQKGIP